MAQIFIDVNGAFNGTQDAKYQIGGGGALGYGITKNLNILYRGMYSTISLPTKTRTIFPPLTSDRPSRVYSHILNAVGVEYVFPVLKARMEWKSSLMIGYSMTTYSYSYIKSDTMAIPAFSEIKIKELEDSGVCFAFWTGLQFIATQYMAPFLDFGFHYSYYNNELADKDIYGISVLIGLRFSIYWKNRSLSSDY